MEMHNTRSLSCEDCFMKQESDMKEALTEKVSTLFLIVNVNYFLKDGKRARGLSTINQMVTLVKSAFCSEEVLRKTFTTDTVTYTGNQY